MKALTPVSRRRAARWGAVVFSPFALCALSLVTGQSAGPRAVFAQQSSPSAAALMAQGAAQEAAGQWETAAKTYGDAAKAYADTGQTTAEADADRKSALMYEKYAKALLSGANAPATPPAPADTPPTPDEAAPTPAPAAPAPIDTPAPPEAAGAAPLPLSKSPLVHPAKNGELAVASATGAPYDGVKISIHDTNIQSPWLVVTADGVIHAAFLERRATTAEMSDIYYRSSADGGHTWTPAKNLSEPIPDRNVGRCRIAADGQGRVYVVWNVAPMQYGTGTVSPHGDGWNNLVYRVLSGGAWNGQPIPIHPMATQATQSIGSLSYTVATDPAGMVHVFWNEDPAFLHPEVMFSSTQELYKAGNGLVMQATLNGTTPTAPSQAYMTPITPRTPTGDPPVCDGVDMLSGYVDGAGASHILALVGPVRGNDSNHFNIIENGGQSPGVNLPSVESTYWHYAPTLLRDAQGRQHIITLYQASEPPAVRDYTVGSEAEPKIIRALKTDKGQLNAFEAFEGPGGEMVALMNMNDTGADNGAELYISTSNGGAWSAPVNITNNAGRFAFHATQTGLHSNTVTESWGIPGPCAATFDRSGHLLVLYVRYKVERFGVNAVGVELAGNDSATPNLMFLRF